MPIIPSSPAAAHPGRPATCRPWCVDHEPATRTCLSSIHTVPTRPGSTVLVWLAAGIGDDPAVHVEAAGSLTAAQAECLAVALLDLAAQAAR